MEQETKAPAGDRWNLPKKLVMAAVLLIIGFLLGYVPSSISSNTIQQQNAVLERRVRAAELGSQLTMAWYEANRNNYANATQFSGRFFSGLPEIIADSKDQGQKQNLEAMLARRDEITSYLAQVDLTVKDKLAEMYAEYFQITQANKLSGQ
jgi:hypothetical protein